MNLQQMAPLIIRDEMGLNLLGTDQYPAPTSIASVRNVVNIVLGFLSCVLKVWKSLYIYLLFIYFYFFFIYLFIYLFFMKMNQNKSENR